MTVQEERLIVQQNVKLIRENIHLLKGRESIGRYRMRGRLRILMKWLEVIDELYKKLRSSAGKSPARAKHDRLIARTIEMMVFEGGKSGLKTGLTGQRRVLSQQYVDRMAEEALRMIMKEAWEAGLLGRRPQRQKT